MLQFAAFAPSLLLIRFILLIFSVDSSLFLKFFSDLNFILIEEIVLFERDPSLYFYIFVDFN